jgi:hypothetical protein
MPEIYLFLFFSSIPISIQIDRKMVAHFGGQNPATDFATKVVTHAQTLLLWSTLNVPYTLSVRQISFPALNFTVDDVGL